MKQKMIKIGFSYFSFNDYLLDHQLALWFSAIQKWNASHVIFTGNFDIAITEKGLLKIGFIKTYDYNMAGDHFNILTYGNLKIWHRKDNYCCLFMQHTFKGLNELKKYLRTTHLQFNL